MVACKNVALSEFSLADDQMWDTRNHNRDGRSVVRTAFLVAALLAMTASAGEVWARAQPGPLDANMSAFSSPKLALGVEENRQPAEQETAAAASTAHAIGETYSRREFMRSNPPSVAASWSLATAQHLMGEWRR